MILPRPGEVLKPGEDEINGLKSRLNQRLSAPGQNQEDIEIGELLSIWYRPNFEPDFYPYCPAHITVVKFM